MLRFRDFITEATLNNATADHHITKYVDPHAHSKDSPLVLSKEHDGHEKGSQIIPHSSGHEDRLVRGRMVRHIKATINGQETHVPISSIVKPSTSSGKYNDEQAVATLWNHSSGDKKKSHVRNLHREIEKAKTDSTHPLHIDNQPAEHFEGRNKTSDVAKKTYYGRLHAAAHLVHKLTRHKDFSDDHKSGHTMEVQGSGRGTLSKKWTSAGAVPAAAVSKGDSIVMKDKNGKPTKAGNTISLKQSGGAQWMSGSPAETAAILKHAVDHVHRHHNKDANGNHVMSEEHRQEHHKTIDAIKDAAEREDHETANKHLQKLLRHEHFNHTGRNRLHDEIAFEAMTGRAKFARKHRYDSETEQRQDGVATHVATYPSRENKNGSLKNPHGETTVKKITRKMAQDAVDKGMAQIPKITSGKAGKNAKKNPSVMRVGGSTKISHFDQQDTPQEHED